MSKVKPYKLLAGDEENRTSSCKGIMKSILQTTRKKYILGPGFDQSFSAFAAETAIDPELWDLNKDGAPKWQQDVRNAAKVGRKQTKPCPLTQGELHAIVGGGFALPGAKLPDGVLVHKFKPLGELAFPDVKPKPKSQSIKKKRERPLKAGETWVRMKRLTAEDVNRRVNHMTKQLRNWVKNVDPRLRGPLVQNILSAIEDGDWVFPAEED